MRGEEAGERGGGGGFVKIMQTCIMRACVIIRIMGLIKKRFEHQDKGDSLSALFIF